VGCTVGPSVLATVGEAVGTFVGGFDAPNGVGEDVGCLVGRFVGTTVGDKDRVGVGGKRIARPAAHILNSLVSDRLAHATNYMKPQFILSTTYDTTVVPDKF
jgi:hypothetical protein